MTGTKRSTMRTLLTVVLACMVLLAASPAQAATVYYSYGYHPYWRYYRSQTAPAPSAPAPQPTPTTSVGSMQMSSWELEVVRLVNAERAKAGLAPLSADAALSRVARYKAADMRDRAYFSHESPTYGSPFKMMRDFGITYRVAGENIAAGYRSPQEVMNAWM
ncbi:MAG: CAP domain-containing protein, partial [Firmicutes bacterium]|nr:CAP domain-containing protein [Bacillota bacterium]